MGSLVLQGLALIKEADGFGGKCFLAKVKVGDLRLGAEDVPSGCLRPLYAKFKLQAAFVDGAAALLARLLELPQPRPQVPQALLALGQLDLGFGRLAGPRLPFDFIPGDLLLQAREPSIHFRQAGFMSRPLLARLGQPGDCCVVLH